MVILGRLVQGLGSATLMPATMAMLRIAFPTERQGYALGIWGATGGVAFALGPLIGGVLTDEASWRWVWWGSLIYAGGLGFMALGTLRGMPRPSERPRVDYLGVALLALSPVQPDPGAAGGSRLGLGLGAERRLLRRRAGGRGGAGRGRAARR